ncbi:sulfatase-like hydrolase/transferase [Bacteroidota bacterium]
MLKFTSLLVLCLSFLAMQKGHSSETPPNIVFIFVDDQGYYDLSCYGAEEVKTTQIDKLAEEGIRFTDYYAAAPICSPSRAGLLTGCYPRRVGNAIWVHRPDSDFGLDPEELTIAELLQQNGYSTACIGKWHLGTKEPFLPRQQGFDYYFGLLNNLDYYEKVHFDDKGGVPILRNEEVVERPADPAKLTKLYTDEAIKWIESSVKDEKSRPFFLYLPHTMFHSPMGVGDDFVGSSNWGEYGDAIQEMDYHVGRLMDKLKELDIADNTLVIYASDNGRRPGRNPDQPISGFKLTTWEGGLRVPCIAWGPGIGIQEGVTSKVMTYAMDWYPTLASIAGVKVPEQVVLDGRDLSSLIMGEASEVSFSPNNISLNADVPLRRYWNPPFEWRETITRDEYLNAFFYFGSVGSLSAVRSGKWKLHLLPDSKLYNLETDPGEQNPVSDNDLKWKMRGMAVMFQEEMELTARPAGYDGPIPSGMGKSSAVYSQADKQPTSITKKSDLLEEHTDLVYSEIDGISLKLDLYRPKYSQERLPAVVCIHGGGWSKGTRQSMGKVAKSLAYNGYVTVTIDYRLSGVAGFPAQIEDCKAAVRWLRLNADKYGIDASRIGATGHSAGGHLTALLATSAGCEKLEEGIENKGISSGISAAVAMGAQTDFLSERNKGVSSSPEKGQIWRQFLGGSQAEKPDIYRLASPLHHLDEKDPPIAILTGELDDESTRADKFREQAEKMGVTTKLMIIEDAPHNFFPTEEWLDMAIYWSIIFFRDNL